MFLVYGTRFCVSYIVHYIYTQVPSPACRYTSNPKGRKANTLGSVSLSVYTSVPAPHLHTCVLQTQTVGKKHIWQCFLVLSAPPLREEALRLWIDVGHLSHHYL